MNPVPTGSDHFSESITFKAEGLEDITRLLKEAGLDAERFHSANTKIGEQFDSGRWGREAKGITGFTQTLEQLRRERERFQGINPPGFSRPVTQPWLFSGQAATGRPMQPAVPLGPPGFGPSNSRPPGFGPPGFGLGNSRPLVSPYGHPTPSPMQSEPPIPLASKVAPSTYGLADDGLSSRQREEQYRREREEALAPQRAMVNAARLKTWHHEVERRKAEANAAPLSTPQDQSRFERAARAITRFTEAMEKARTVAGQSFGSAIHGNPVARSLADQRLSEMRAAWKQDDDARKAKIQHLGLGERARHWWSGDDQFARAERHRQEFESRRDMGFYGRHQQTIHGLGNVGLGISATAFGMGMAGLRDTVVMNKFQNETERTQREMGRGFAPIVEWGTDRMRDVGNWFSRRSNNEMTGIGLAATAGVGYGALKMAGLGGLVTTPLAAAGRAGGPALGSAGRAALPILGSTLRSPWAIPLAVGYAAVSSGIDANQRMALDEEQSRGIFDAEALERRKDQVSRYQKIDNQSDRRKAAREDEAKYSKEFSKLDSEYSSFGRKVGSVKLMGFGFLGSYGRRQEDLREQMRLAEQTATGKFDPTKPIDDKANPALAGGNFESFMQTYQRTEGAFGKLAPAIDQNAGKPNAVAIPAPGEEQPGFLAGMAGNVADMWNAQMVPANAAKPDEQMAQAQKELAKGMEALAEAMGRLLGLQQQQPMQRNING